MSTLSKAGSKIFHLLTLLPKNPREFNQRVSIMLGARLDSRMRKPPRYDTVSWQVLAQGVDKSLSVKIADLLRERELQEVEDHVERALREARQDLPFGTFHNGDLLLGRLCYALTRAMKPRTVIETGVCYGVTTSFLLGALRLNGSGVLHSIDLPPLGQDADHFVGSLVPSHLKDSWKLYRGLSNEWLPKILESNGEVGLFVHDSLHTYENIRRELATVTPYLAPVAAVIVDDVEGNGAFGDWAQLAIPQFLGVTRAQSKPSSVGVGIFRDPNRKYHASE
jgi:hypothetical protein